MINEMTQLTPQLQQLIQQARIVSFHHWKDYPPEVIARFQQADDQSRYLTDDDIRTIITLVPHLTETVKITRSLCEAANEIVSSARADLLAEFPQITAPGGALYPSSRADACWRDLWQFLRCISYGIAGQKDFTSKAGLMAMEELYQELNVPLDAMVFAVSQLKVHSLERFELQQRNLIAPAFDHLIDGLKGFS